MWYGKQGFIASIFLIFFTTFSFASNQKIVVYYKGWHIYFPGPDGTKFTPLQLHVDAVTHINYAFIKPLNVDQLLQLDESALNSPDIFKLMLHDPWVDIEYKGGSTHPNFDGNFGQLHELKIRYPHLKTLVSVGGWTLSNDFSAIAANPIARSKFIRILINFAHYFGFDGVDLDWEFPRLAEHNGKPEDTQNFTLLLAELYQEAKKADPEILVTIAAPVGPRDMEAIELEKIHHYVDWLNIMAYNFHGPWPQDEVTGHLAPLYAQPVGHPLFNIDSAIQRYLARNVPAEKIVLGMPLYGRGFAGVKSNHDGLYAGYEKAYPGGGRIITFPQFPKIDYATSTFSGGLLDKGFQRYWDDQCKVPYLWNNNEKIFITYDDVVSLSYKVEYVKEHSLGGIMLWAFDYDVWSTLTILHETLVKEKSEHEST